MFELDSKLIDLRIDQITEIFNNKNLTKENAHSLSNDLQSNTAFYEDFTKKRKITQMVTHYPFDTRWDLAHR